MNDDAFQVGLDCASGKDISSAPDVTPCDLHVFSSGENLTPKWFWNCRCGAEGGPFQRRMDADVAAGNHVWPARGEA